jgi:raffinose/stachyose/melibiose transport system permease protein
MTLKRLTQDDRLQAVLLLGPAVLIYLTFAIYPMIDVVVLSFEKWNGLDASRQFVGIGNYVDIFTRDPVFWRAFRNTVVWTALSLIFPPLIGLLLALGLNQPIFGRNTLRAVYYLPVIIAPIAVATMWRWMYDPFFGLFAQILTALGRPNWVQDWLGNKELALYSAFAAHVWQSAGFSMVLFLAGLQGVPKTLVEAARIDGAGRWDVFRHVTLPALRTTVTIVLVLSVISSLKAFDIVYGLTGGGPAQATQMLALWAFTQAMQIFDFGRGSAITVVLLVITLCVVVPYLRWTQRREENEA